MHSLMFIAGDPSGDHHAAPLLRQLRAQRPDLPCFGIGGPAMEAEGFTPLMPFAPFNCMGYGEVVAHLPFFLSAKRRMIDVMRERRPSALVCVDYPGFNFPMMKAARELGIPVVWYIVPQVWAWKPQRAEVLARQASFIGVVFPFEEKYFQGSTARVAFVGHPLVESLESRRDQLGARLAESATRQAQGRLRLALLPGSRAQEVGRMLPVMTAAALRVRSLHPGIEITVSRVPHLSARLYTCATRAGIDVFAGNLNELLARTDLALVASGTATLQTALWQIPLVVTYRTSRLTYALLRRMVKLPDIGLPNIVAGQRIVPECIQDEVAPDTLFAALRPLIDSYGRYTATVERLGELRGKLGDKHPSEEMTAAILEIMDHG